MSILIFCLCFAAFAINYENVKDDLVDVLNSAPADWEDTIYAGFFIRLAWHCSGTYRTSDGRGGCNGASIRFDPEINWGANTKLDQALALLEPTKLKYGSELSWGDLIILAGNVAIEQTGGPLINFCGGREDVYDGSDSEDLNQDIYLDGAIRNHTALRESLVIMDMTDQEIVALVGGGHAYGRCHADVSGFVGPWTHTPTQFSNSYFKNMLNEDWQLTHSSVGNEQYENADNSLTMLGTDLAFLDDEVFQFHVAEYAKDANFDQFKADFAAAWEKLTNRDFGNKPCHDATPEVITNDYSFTWTDVKEAVTNALENDDCDDGYCGGLFVRLAWHCSGTYRSTDHLGGCNGATIRHDPEINWGANIGLQNALDLLKPIRDTYSDLTWADLIVIAGTTALEDMGAPEMTFCPGRYDSDTGSSHLNEDIYLDAEIGTADDIRDTMLIMGFTEREIVALNGGGHSIGRCHASTSGFEGPWTHTPETFSNSFFTLLLNEEWTPKQSSAGRTQWTDANGLLTMLHTDLALADDPKFRAIVIEFAGDEDLFRQEFAAAWIKLMNADRFNNVCYEFENPMDCAGSWGSCDQNCMETYTITVTANQGGSSCAFTDGESRECSESCEKFVVVENNDSDEDGVTTAMLVLIILNTIGLFVLCGFVYLIASKSGNDGDGSGHYNKF